ncbi:glycosyltransferase family 2 protein [Halorhodospira sp. 9622]|uniref:glycosyltransferase family 2 protein n=1 Tax=Halorhodospira sp. 9622 TaxID=2899136 RepID=UPI001EE940BB|nr:glycosyltransferase family 2 protein [Halorhodospira sp. 9622]MCG5538611.1 glycosyltransferase [Halorhodospira sp. 9622]
MHQPPKISVIIPAYNTELYVKEALESVAQQDHPNIELICIDDASEDGTADAIRSFEPKFNEFILLQQPTRLGPGAARNIGLQKASGDYIAFLDSDDLMAPNMMSELLTSLLAHDADMALCRIKKFSNKTGELFPNDNNPEELQQYENNAFSWKDLQGGVFNLRFICVNRLYRKAFLERNQIHFPEGIFYEDLPFTYACLFSARRVAYTTETYYLNRRFREGSTTHWQNDTVSDLPRAFEALEERLKLDDLAPDIINEYNAFKFKQLNKHLHRNTRRKINGYYNALKTHTLETDIHKNAFLTKKEQDAATVIASRGPIDYVLYDYWLTKKRITKKKRKHKKKKDKLDGLQGRGTYRLYKKIAKVAGLFKTCRFKKNSMTSQR